MNQIQLERIMSQNPDKTYGEEEEGRWVSPYGKTKRPLPPTGISEGEREALNNEMRRRSPSKVTKRTLTPEEVKAL